MALMAFPRMILAESTACVVAPLTDMWVPAYQREFWGGQVEGAAPEILLEQRPSRVAIQDLCSDVRSEGPDWG